MIKHNLTIKSANGVEGSLLYSFARKDFVFRVYDEVGKFIDYDIRHCDCTMVVNDLDAFFYSKLDDNGAMQHRLDHSPETLGEAYE